jgi:hypothetical protein
MASTQAGATASESSGESTRPPTSAWLGALAVLSAALLVMVFAGIDSLQFRLGYVFGKLLVSIALALPVFVVVRFATQRGRRMKAAQVTNLLCFLMAGFLVVQLMLVATVPALIQRLGLTSDTAPGVRAESSAGDGKSATSATGMFDDLMPYPPHGDVEGMMFGYRLGARYAVAQPTSRRALDSGAEVLVADKPIAPDGFDRVELIVTPKTKTIGNVYARAEVVDEGVALALAERQATMLMNLYGNRCVQKSPYLPSQHLVLVCGAQFEISVNRFSEKTSEGKRVVQVNVKLETDTDAHRRWVGLLREEVGAKK